MREDSIFSNIQKPILFYGNLVTDYLYSALVFFIVYIALRFVKHAVIKRVSKLLKKTKTHWDEAVFQAIDKFLSQPVLIVISLYFASKILELDSFIVQIVDIITLTVVTIYVILSTEKLLKYGIKLALDRLSKENTDEELEDPSLVNLVFNISRILLWTIAILMLIQNLGYNVTAIFGALGIAGVAIAFGMQSILGDVFSYFTIHIDRPFKVGDFIMLGTDGGTVENIGIKSTRIKTLKGEELIVSNQELTSIRVNNFKKMKTRRVVINFGVTYDTNPTKLRKISKLVKTIIEKEKLAEFDRAHFTELGESSLNFEVIYHMTDKDFTKYRNTNQRVLLKLMDALEEEEIEFAFPTQTIHLEK